MQKKEGLWCQSCGMPLEKNKIETLGTHADGSHTQEYCVYCYQKGSFTQPDITLEQMKEQVKKIMWDKFYIPSFISYFFVRNIPQLKRWQHHQ